MTEKVEAEHRVKLEQLNSIKDEQKWVLSSYSLNLFMHICRQQRIAPSKDEL